jgi:DNA-directed RNA polymerase
MGKDKATISEKLAFIEDNLDLIKAIGKDPFKNREWLKNEDCWQSLGATIELCDALDSPNP